MKVTVTEISEHDAFATKFLRTIPHEKHPVPIVFPDGGVENSAEVHTTNAGKEKITWSTLYSGVPRGGLPLPLQTGDCVFWDFEGGCVHIKGLLRVPEDTKPVHKTFFMYAAKRFFAKGLPSPHFSSWNDSSARSSALLFSPNYLPLTRWNHVHLCSLRRGHPTDYESTKFAGQLEAITEAFKNALHPCPHVIVQHLRTVMSDDPSWLTFVDKHYELECLANRFCDGTAECTTSYHDFKREWMTIEKGKIRRTPEIFAPKSHQKRPDLLERATRLGVKSTGIHFH